MPFVFENIYQLTDNIIRIYWGLVELKKVLFILIAILLLAACGQDSDSKSETVEKTSDPVEVEKTEEEPKDIGSFDGKVAEDDMVKIEITKMKTLEVGEEGNEYGETPVLAIWYEATNKTDEELDPIGAWFHFFVAVQDNDDDMVNELEVGMLPDESHLDSQMNMIKEGGTVENSIAYELDDLETPVTLIAKEEGFGEEIGREDFEVK